MLRPLAAAAALTLVAAACSGDDDTTSQPSIEIIDPLSTTIAPADLDGDVPPVDAINSLPLFADEFERLGLRLTNRGGLIDRSDGGYTKSVNGDHYALYVEPISDDYSLQDFVDGLSELTAITAPLLFERYPGLESYDICQEPRSVDNDDPYPPPITQIDLSRANVESVEDWDNFGLAELFALKEDGGTVVVSQPIFEHPDVSPFVLPA